MAIDSIMARPTNRVRVMAPASSGCWAIAVRACITARPSERAGPMVPIAVVRPAVMIETRPMIVTVSIALFLLLGNCLVWRLPRGRPRTLPPFLVHGGGRSNIDRGQYRKDVGLDHADQEA